LVWAKGKSFGGGTNRTHPLEEGKPNPTLAESLRKFKNGNVGWVELSFFGCGRKKKERLCGQQKIRKHEHPPSMRRGKQ